MATEKKQSFFGGAAVLAVGVVIVKIIGALFKIPLANILSETGNADFNNAYNIYAVLLTISTAGLPVALSKMISEAKTLGRERQARRVLKVSFAAFLTLGVLSFVIMWFGNEKCAALLNNPNAAYGIKALAPGVVCVGCLAAFRGFAQGSFRMTPTAVSQLIEAVRQLFIQSPAKASFSCIVIEINGQLARPVVCGAADKGMCVCITFDFSILLDDEVWIFFHDITHAVLKFFQRRHVPLERNDGVFYIISINLQNACGILYFCISYCICLSPVTATVSTIVDNIIT